MLQKTSKEELDLIKLCKLTQIVRMLYGTQPAQIVFEKYFKLITGLTLHDVCANIKVTSKFNKE